MEDILKAFEPPVNPNIPELRTGDTVNVQVKIREGNRERIQEFRGTVLFVHNNGANSTFTVRRVRAMALVWNVLSSPVHPRIAKVIVERHNKICRSRLYFLRERTGKSARLKQKFN